MLCQLPRCFVIGALLLALVACPMAVESSAATIIGDSVALSTLVNNPTGTVQVGDKLFDNFGYSSTGDMPNAAGVNVVPIQDDAGNFGIRFHGAFIDLPSSFNGSDALITYRVSVTDPLYQIKAAHLQGNPNVLGSVGSISVTETFLPLGAGGEYTMQIFDDENINQAVLVDSTEFNPRVTSLNVQKDILALALPNSQSVTLSFVDQTFEQEIIPEASTIVLLVSGAVGLVTLRRRQR